VILEWHLRHIDRAADDPREKNKCCQATVESIKEACYYEAHDMRMVYPDVHKKVYIWYPSAQHAHQELMKWTFIIFCIIIITSGGKKQRVMRISTEEPQHFAFIRHVFLLTLLNRYETNISSRTRKINLKISSKHDE